ncbi:unnamed protein product [Gadus morhua 'NCC']
MTRGEPPGTGSSPFPTSQCTPPEKWYGPADVTHCLQIKTGLGGSLPNSVVRVGSGPQLSDQTPADPCEQPPEKPERMPCRKENYIFLEQSVTVDSKEVDALVTKIGEALQLHNNSTGGQKTMACLHHGVSVDTNAGLKHAGGSVTNVGFAMQQKRGGQGCCMRLRNRSHRSSRASPYGVPVSGDQEWNHIKPWNKKRLTAAEDDDPHRLLQELILSGNLIKEAVRRLQFPAAECGDFSAGSDSVSC